jgi:hypothetical protein
VTLDVGFNQNLAVAPDILTSPGYFEFAGILPVAFPTIPLEQHVAEKLHAYTRMYREGRTSSRTKDLVDLVLICQHSEFRASKLKDAIDATFNKRSSQQVPTSLPTPPTEWISPYRQLAIDTGLDPDITVGYAIAARFLEPVLSQEIPGASCWALELGLWK